MSNYCYLNGAIIPSSEAKISVYDIGILRSYGIYEGMTTFNGKVFRLDDHLSRFENSAKALGLTIPVSRKEIEKILSELYIKNGFERTNFRMILTGGEAIGGISFDSAKSTFYILTEPHEPLPAEVYTSGAMLMTFEHQRFMPEAKTTNYITAVKLQPERKKRGALEILFVSQGKILEAATSNIFIVKNGALITPKDSILLGITRKVVLELASKEFKIEEREVTIEEMKNADEVFISSSYKDIVPVVQIDEMKIGDSKVGPVTKNIIQLFNEYTKNYSYVYV